MSDLVFARNCSIARMLPGEAENGVGMNRSAKDRILRYIKTTFLNRLRRRWRQSVHLNEITFSREG